MTKRLANIMYNNNACDCDRIFSKKTKTKIHFWSGAASAIVVVVDVYHLCLSANIIAIAIFGRKEERKRNKQLRTAWDEFDFQSAAVAVAFLFAFSNWRWRYTRYSDIANAKDILAVHTRNYRNRLVSLACCTSVGSREQPIPWQCEREHFSYGNIGLWVVSSHFTPQNLYNQPHTVLLLLYCLLTSSSRSNIYFPTPDTNRMCVRSCECNSKFNDKIT